MRQGAQQQRPIGGAASAPRGVQWPTQRPGASRRRAGQAAGRQQSAGGSAGAACRQFGSPGSASAQIVIRRIGLGPDDACGRVVADPL